MGYVYKQKLGRGMVEITENDFKAIWPKAAFLGDMPTNCECGSDNIKPMHKTPKGFEYFGLQCSECGRQLTFHQRQDGGFYIKWDDKFEKFSSKQDGGSQEETVRKVFEDDVPF